MRNALIKFPAVVLLMGASLASSQTCESVYSTAVRNVDLETRTLVETNDLFSKHCESNGSMRQSSAGLDLTIPIKGIVVGFSGSQAEAQQEMQKFCKSYAQNFARNESFYKLSNFVVTDALKSYNQCKAIEVNKVAISHLATESRSLVVSVSFNPATANVQVFGVQYDKTLATCRSDVYGKGVQVVDESSGSVRAAGPFAIACDRIAEQSKDGEKKFPRLEVLVNTSAGPYAVTMPVETVLGFDLASQNRLMIEAQARRNAELNIRNNEILAKNNELLAKIAGIQVKAFNVVQGEGAQVNCAVFGGNLEQSTKAMCGDGWTRGALQQISSNSGKRCGYTSYRFACYQFP